jgi:hypothetical protein
MKLRMGFVSNSSATSFCIYGWTFEELEPFGVKRWEQHDLLKMLDAKYPDLKSSLTESQTPISDWIIGVGSATGYGFDHGYHGDWQDYKSPGPTKEQMEKLDKVAVEMGWSKPSLNSATWFDG